MSGDNTQEQTSAHTGSGPASHAALPKGTRLQEFQVVEVVGEGGFGIVYLADDLQLHRAVAVKEYMPASLASRGDGETVVVRSEQHLGTFQAGMRSFIAEARMLAQFKHPALVEVLRFWEQNGTAYMAMPYYKGRTLRQVLHDDSHLVDERWLKTLFSPLMDALELMHAQSIYHRDVAPDNILILSNGAPVLLDLGAARRIIGDLTQAVTVVLKPGYAPVEQYADDGSATQGPWTDVYAVGAVLYFAITGRPPVASVSRIMKDTLKPLDSANHPGYSDEFLSGIAKALAVKPEDRPQSIAELREVLGVSSYAATTMLPPITTSFSAAHERTTPTQVRPTSTVPASMAQTAKAPVANDAPTILVSAAPATSKPVATEAPPPAPQPNEAADAGQVAIDTLFQAAPGEDALGMADSAPSVTQAPPKAEVKTQTKTEAKAPPAKSSKEPGKSPLPMLAGIVVLLGLAGAGAYVYMGSEEPAKPVVATVQEPAAPIPAAPPAPVSQEAAPAQATAEPPAPVPITPPPAPEVHAQAPEPHPAPPVKLKPEAKPTPPSVSVEADATSGTDAASTTEGRVRFVLNPWGEVWVDGVNRGPSPPLKSLKLPVGKHRIELRNPGFPSETRKIKVTQGAMVTVEHHFTNDAGYNYGGN
jgi:non-specific serine/threonine protein kinase